MQHELKTDPEVFAAVLIGAKTHEIRKNDRNFAVGDELLLRETTHTGAEIAAGAPLAYTGRETVRIVSHVLTGYGLQDGWCILSLATTVTIQPVAAPEQVMADGKTRLSDYLENTLPDGECSDEWTKGYEECKRRLFKVVGAQLRAAPAQAVPVAPASEQQDLAKLGTSITRTHTDGTIERIDPLSIYKKSEVTDGKL